MAVYLTLTVTVLVIALLIRKTEIEEKSGNMLVYRGMSRQKMVNNICLLIIFVLLFGVSALRLNVGNDYLNYVEFMHLVFSKAYVPTELGFNVLTYVVYYLCGFENYILVFALFAFATIYFFMKAMLEQSEWFTFSFMMFMLLGYYFQSLSTVRYYLALSMALYSIKYLMKGDYPKFLLIVIIGSLFHKSLLVVLLLYFVAKLDFKRWMYVALIIAGISCLFLKDIYLKIVVFLYPSYKNTEYLAGGTSGANIVRCLVILAFSLYLYNDVVKDNKNNKFYFMCNVLATVLYIFGSFLPVISRIGYYLTVTHILFIPVLIKGIKDENKRNIAIVVTVIACLGYFAMYMRGAAGDGIRILPYETFLFHDLPLTLSERGYS
ncbi:EpsG family protein [Butyrivibrio sp. YAB3001]|uniref:EpsG family protein n=1 Tax=Butyrivibrio sp. YAB3001 TaxID=1520812 RepID=UPI0008F68AB9|nr:EpsG family protein [Butyrivibrio sp. YAB3001]SFC17382.1 EpsG family protein [Butyrivibrio sp. YAB3001]